MLVEALLLLAFPAHLIPAGFPSLILWVSLIPGNSFLSFKAVLSRNPNKPAVCYRGSSEGLSAGMLDTDMARKRRTI